jgi:cell division protein FtsI/penicillin-binding protein 2
MNRLGSSSRYSIIGGALTVAGLFIFVWMIRIQTSDSADLIRKKAEEYYTYTHKTIYPERGNIYDRWGHLLAGSTEVYELGADLRYVDDAETIAMTVSSLLGMDSKTVYDLLTVEFDPEYSRYITLSKNVSPEKINEIKIQKQKLEDQASKVSDNKSSTMPSLDGLLWTPSLQRSYPEHSLASTILGFYSFLDRENGRGYFGIEEKYNHLMAGSAVNILVPVDPYLIDKPPSIPPGDSLILTIDREVQDMVEKVVDRAVEDNGAQSGTIIVMDPRNGEILAMATTPRMDPTEYWKYEELFPNPTPYNRAVGQTYEPGSVFKVLTMAAAVDAGTVTPDTPFLDTGVISVGGIDIYNWDRGAWGPQTMTTCMQHSLNVCLAWVATELGPTNFYNYMQRFGIGHMTGIDLAGEVNWPLSIAGDPNWYPVNLGTNSFGQGVATTPIQMITAIAAVANPQGRMMAPHVLRSVIENGEKYNNPPQVIGNPITGETARIMTEMLAQSLEEESSNALVEGYRVAGKTGTAEIPGPDGYSGSLTNASFVGWGPADDPRFIVYVWLEKPTSSPWGSIVASPVFSEVVSKLVILLDLPPDDVRIQLASQ